MTVAPSLVSLDEYLRLEQTSETRHEYVAGELVAMAGESQEHEDIVLNGVEALRPVARAKAFRLYTTTIKLRVTAKRYRYPDVMVLCNPKSESGIESEPCFLLEVLSDSTAQTDLSKKLREYTEISSLERYAIVSQTARLVIIYSRTLNGWQVQTLENLGEIDIPCLGVKLSLEQLYEGLSI
jgi:Uma2 family endonuclease